MSGIEKFYMKILVILPKFYEKTLSSPGYIFLYYTLLPFMDGVFSEERELMKWVRILILQCGNIWVRILRGDFFSGGEGGRGGVDGWEFFRGKFPRIMVSKVCLRLG